MMTNIIAHLYTTFAYQSAVMHLLVGQANFDAQQLNLRESLPIVVPANTNQWRVPMPPEGMSTHLVTSNCIYQFQAGQLVSIQSRSQPHQPADAGPSLIDTNGAYQLARQWLTALSVDVSALDAQYPHTVSSITALPAPSMRRGDRNELPHRINEISHNHGGPTNNIPRPAHSMGRLPVFRVSWGGGNGQPRSAKRTPIQASVEILGSTKQCLSLRLSPGLITAPPLRVTNADALLGRLPPPQHFVEGLLGGTAAYNAVASPDHVYVWLRSSLADGADSQTNRSAAMAIAPATASQISRTLTDFDSYAWLDDKGCTPDYGVGFRFTKGDEVVDVLWNFGCDHLQITHNGESSEKDCDAARPVLLRAVQSAFPNDRVIRSLSL